MTKRIIAFICVLALLLSTPIASVEAASTSDTYRVGFSKVDITPDPTEADYGLNGYGDQSSRIAKSIMTPAFLKSELQAGNTNISNASSQAKNIPTNANEDMYHLYASCIAVTDQADTTILMMTLDIISVVNSLSESMRMTISEATGVPEENITITHTHTHSAPKVSSNSAWRKNVVIPGLVQAAKEALLNRSEATMYEGSVTASGMTTVRHYYTSSSAMTDDAGQRHVKGSNFGSIYYNGTAKQEIPVQESDENMNLLMFKMKDSKKRDIVLCNFRVHACRDSSDSVFKDSHASYTAISSDFIGPMRDALEQEGYDFAYFQGSAGNVAAEGELCSYSYGTKLADYALDGLTNNMNPVEAGPIKTQRVDMEAHSYQPVETDIEPAQTVVALYNDLLDGDPQINDTDLKNIFNSATYTEKSVTKNWLGNESVSKTTVKVNATYSDYKADGKISTKEAKNIANRLAYHYGLGNLTHANNIVKYSGSQKTSSLQLNAITLGDDIAIVTDPAEVFDDLTQDLVDYYGKRTFVIGYTNGSNGYLPNKASFQYNATKRSDGTIVYGGSYETHSTDFAMGTGAKVASTFKIMLDHMTQIDGRYACACAGAHTDTDECTELLWEPWTSTNSLPSSGNYYLTDDVVVSNSTELQGTLNLDLNGMTIQGKNGVFTMATGDHLVVTDSYPVGKLGTSGIPIVANAGSKLTVYAGTVGGTIKNNGANVELWGKPSLYINMAKNAPAMDCRNLQTDAYVYVVTSPDQCFATVSNADQRACFVTPNDYNLRYEDGGLYLTSKQLHCVCSGSLSGQGTDHVCELVSWQPWTKSDSLPTTTGNYYLTSNVYLSEEQVIAENATVRLDLSGKNIYVGQVLDADGNRVVTEEGIRAFYIHGNSTLELCSSATGYAGALNGRACAPTTRDNYGGVIHAAANSTLNLYNNITITGNRYTKESSDEAYKRTATANRGGCIYTQGSMTIYGGTITDGAVTGTNARGGNVYSNGAFAMYGGTIEKGVGTGINLFLASSSNATIGGNAYINAGIYLNKGTLTLTGAPHIPAWERSDSSTYGISVANNTAIINAENLDAEAMAQKAPNGDAVHCINIKLTGANDFAKVSTPAQASFFESYSDDYDTHYYAADEEGYIVALYSPTTDTRYGCICCDKLIDSDNHACSILTWQPWTSTNSLPTEGNYYLTADVAVTSTTEVAGELNLDLKGHTISASGSQRVFNVGDNKTLRITDSGNGGKIDASGVTFEYEFTYENLNNSAHYGGVIHMTKGTFELYGGTLIGASNVSKGGILSTVGGDSKSSLATVNIYGGTMTEGEALYYGGGIYMAYTTLNMYDGLITDCTAGRGGSIYQTSCTVVKIHGGTIANGTANRYDTIASGSTTTTEEAALGGNIYLNYVSTSKKTELIVNGGVITGGTANGDNGNGGNIAACGNNITINGGKITNGSAANMGDNIYVTKILTVNGGEICNPAEGYNIGLWNGADVILSGGKIYGGTYGIFNGSKGGDVTLKGNVSISGSTCGISINDSYSYDKTTGTYTDDGNHATLTVNKSFTGSVDVSWKTNTYNALGIAEGREIEHTTATGYTGTGTLICTNLNQPLVCGANGKLVIAPVAIANGNGVMNYYPSFADALAAYELKEGSADQSYIQLQADQTDVAVTESIYLDLNGYDLSVASVASGCNIYGMDSVTNQYTHYNKGTDISGKLTLENGIDPACIVKDVHIDLTKNTTRGTRKYLALEDNGAYTFHRYYLSLAEAGLRPSDAGIFYNAVFYGDEAVANAVTKYGVQVSTTSTFEEGSSAISDYQSKLGAFQAGTAGNKGYRTVLKGILSENGVTPVKDYSSENIYGRAYIEANGVTLYCSNTGSTNLRTIIKNADTAYGKDALSTEQKNALDTMYNKYSKIMESWNILGNIGRVEIDINDLFAKDPKKDDELNILLIGNSFSFYWVEELYELLAEGSGYARDKIYITNVYYSGCPLKNHWNWLETGAANYNIGVTTNGVRNYPKDVTYDLNAVITGDLARNWDFISLQQNSGAFADGDVNYARETLEPYLSNLLSSLRSKYPKAEYMWHQFWAHEVGHEDVSDVAGQTAFHDTLVSIGNEISQLYNMTIVPTGEAWELVRYNDLITNSPLLQNSSLSSSLNSANITQFTLCTRTRVSSTGVEYLGDDLYHDGDIGGGQFLNACVWYEKITGNSVLDLDWTPTYQFKGKNYSLTDEQVALLKYAAHAAVAKYTPHDDPSQDNETNILLIGNVFSCQWTDELKGMLEAAGYPNVSIYTAYEGSCNLEAYWTGYQSGATSHTGGTFEFRLNNTTSETGLTLFDCITRKNWDMISLQQSGSYVYGSTGSVDKFVTNSDPYVKNLLSTLRGMFPKAEYYWLQNWAYEVYESGIHSSNTNITSLAKRQRIAGIFRDGSNEICKKYGLTNVPCGDAWELVRDNPLVNYDTYDLTSQTSPTGSITTTGKRDGDYCGGQYLNACVWFETITGTSCLDNTFVPSYNNNGTVGNLTDDQIALLKQSAHDAVATAYGDEDSLNILVIGASLGYDVMYMMPAVAQNEGLTNVNFGILYRSASLYRQSGFVTSGKPEYAYLEYVSGQDTVWRRADCDGNFTTSIPDEANDKYIENGFIAVSAEFALQRMDWDVVIILPSSSESTNVENDLDMKHADIIMDYVKEHDPVPATVPKFGWHMVWTSPQDETLWKESTRTLLETYFNGDANLMFEASMKTAQEIVVPALEGKADYIFPCAAAFQNAKSSTIVTDKDVQRDYIHGTDYGRMIAAYVWYCQLTGTNIRDCKFGPVPNGLVRDKTIRESGEDYLISEAWKNVLIESVENALANPYTLTQSAY